MSNRAKYWSLVVVFGLAATYAACTDQLGPAGPDSGGDAPGSGDGSDKDAAADAGGDASLLDSAVDAADGAPSTDSGGGVVVCEAGATILLTDTGKLFGVAVDGTNIYWANQSTNKIMMRPLAGGTPVPLATNKGLPTDVTVDSNYVYFADAIGTGSGGTLERVSKDGGGETTIASGQGVYGLAAVGSFFFISNHDNGVVGTMPIGGGAFSPLKSEQFPAGAGATATAGFYVLGSGDVKSIGYDDGGAQALIASGQANPYDVASDGQRAFWTTLYGTKVMQAPLDGGAATPFDDCGKATSGIAVDDACVYWTTWDGSGVIYTMAK